LVYAEGIGGSLFERFFQKKKAEKFIIIIRGVNISEEYIKLSGIFKYNLRKCNFCEVYQQKRPLKRRRVLLLSTCWSLRVDISLLGKVSKRRN
ncbi:TPA: hypothetical protein ACIS4J_003823, partial [Salmonella enterica subsp. enterica serovar Enteritidis]